MPSKTLSLKIGLVSLGCARTLVDSEVALGSLKAEGYQIVSDVRRADVAIVNTCGFIESAKMESIETILELCERKKKGSLSAVVVLGCLAQRYGPELEKELKEVDAIVGTDSFGDLARILAPLKAKHGKVFEVRGKPRYLLDENTPRVALTPKHYSYVKISEGCINACSYCVIPRMKGAHRSRTIESVLEEIKALGRRGVSEANLIGQDTAAFGFDRTRRFELAALLREAAKSGGVPWVRFLYAHPGHVTEELIQTIAENPEICKYVDFPIEHSHDAMLKRMNRGVTRAEMVRALEGLRKNVPGIGIRTTVIVGFPGETDEEFLDLMEFLKEARFERLGAFTFSEEEGSRAYGMAEQIPASLKDERFRTVMEEQRRISTEINEGLIGKTLEVLIDEKGGEDGLYYGRTAWDAPEVDGQVVVHSSAALKPGDFSKVLITDALEYDLIGDRVGA